MSPKTTYALPADRETAACDALEHAAEKHRGAGRDAILAAIDDPQVRADAAFILGATTGKP